MKIVRGRLCNLILAVFLPLFSYEQNLVPNPSFELVNTCNVTDNSQTVAAVENWFAVSDMNNSPEIFHTCFIEPLLQPPSTFAGYSYPHLGEAMAGVGSALWYNFREIISVRLTEELTNDSAYCIEFFVKNCNADNVDSWSQNLSLVFSQDTIFAAQQQIVNGDIVAHQILDGEEWIKLSGYYIAGGGEKFISIGFFGNNETYHPSPPPNNFVYYFIDDVLVIPCNKDSLLSVYLELPNVLTINNDHLNDWYVTKHNNLKSLQIAVFDRWGAEIISYDGLTSEWDGKNPNGDRVTDGVYFVKAVAESVFGDILQKQQFVQTFSH